MNKCPQSSLPTPTIRQTLKEDLVTISYHYVRLFKMMYADVRKGLKKPASGKRTIAPLSDHQRNYLSAH